jgi:predicted GIY-YIG superfamily endonuclease
VEVAIRREKLLKKAPKKAKITIEMIASKVKNGASKLVLKLTGKPD